jgi:molybdopterin/thiamine biosynthesis adenylyltransferase
MGVTTGFFGVMQAAEVIKLLLGIGELMTNKLFITDLLKNRFEVVKVDKKNSCPSCKAKSKLKKTETPEAKDYEGTCEIR